VVVHLSHTQSLGGNQAHILEGITIPNGKESSWGFRPGYHCWQTDIEIPSTNSARRRTMLDFSNQKLRLFIILEALILIDGYVKIFLWDSYVLIRWMVDRGRPYRKDIISSSNKKTPKGSREISPNRQGPHAWKSTPPPSPRQHLLIEKGRWHPKYYQERKSSEHYLQHLGLDQSCRLRNQGFPTIG